MSPIIFAVSLAVLFSTVSCNEGPQYIRTEWDTCREWAEAVARDAASNADAPPFITVACRGRGYSPPDAGAPDADQDG